MEKGKGKWVRIINILYVHIRVATCLNEIKKGGETSKSKIQGSQRSPSTIVTCIQHT